ncbi:MAG: winged helix-turn-helix transcriptional regulator [Clostridiales bacterium]|nr:winged helix-turn-helix transcriptional regulator [Clostridiales bacterium]MBS5878002.1 winged helix-turn-helix transcriptional regulator [Clostridiales bacterium]MDU0939896.1 metalloregulator ArsR/SmtB family transcription factor [Clostridiales bacterium]MDU1042422.1 metalloregulator ArsR/SmtB family transcription factor [Clostridiales bacterium]MDU3489890.1 metalloregulator ArsR/SmtB family transcription factor [Clostridiales bacterium]
MNESINQAVAELFKVFGDSTRIGILCALQEKELCVEEIAAKLGKEQSAISHQLRILKSAKLVKVRKDGRFANYSLDDDHVNMILKMGKEHVCEK